MNFQGFEESVRVRDFFCTVLEYMAVRRRSLVVNVAFGVYFAIGSSMLPWMAYYLADWRKLCYFSAVPLVCCLITPWILPESAR